MNYIDTYYSRTVSDAAPPMQTLGDSIQAEVCVIGGGLAGINTALELTRLGRHVCLLEANRFSWGASGRNGGFVSPGYSAGQDHIQRQVGASAADELFRLSLEGMQGVLDNIESLKMPDIQLRHGVLKTIRYNDPDALKRQRDLMHSKFGYVLELMPREELLELLKSEKYFQALHDKNAFQLHPLNYSLGLIGEMLQHGAQVFENSPALEVGKQGSSYVVKTPLGKITTQAVVYTTGGYTGALVPRLQRSFLPIATYVLLSEKNPELLQSAIQTPDGVGDSRRAGDYYRLVEGGDQLLWGGRITTRTTEPEKLAQLLRNTMISTYPQLSGLRIEIAWSGLMSYARHLMPQLGRLDDGCWYCTAFGGHGLNTTTLAGRLMAEAITGTSDRYKQFAPFGLAWNGGAVGTAAVQLTYWYLQLMDYLKERHAGAAA